MPLTRLTTARATPELLLAVRSLMDRAFEGEFSDEDWDHTLGGWHVVSSLDGIIVGHAAVVPRTIEVGGRPFATGYVEGVATDPVYQRAGHGTSIMADVGALIRNEFELGALSSGLHSFYERLGWKLWKGPTYVRDGATLRRTEGDDGGIMVLRFGSSRTVDLSAPISCEARSGDDW